MEEILVTDFERPIQVPAMQAMIEQYSGVEITFDKASILAQAQAQLDVPLDDDDALYQRFMAIYHELAANGPVHAAGEVLYQQTMVSAYVQNSRMRWICEQHPEVGATPLAPPLVIAGMPRSGTTYLQQLLSSEPQLISLLRWEAVQSFPSSAALQGHEPDNRRELGAAMIEAGEEMLPLLPYMYGATPDEAYEEIALQTFGSHCVSMTFFGDVPNFDSTLYTTPQNEGYQYLYRYLQALTWLKETSPNQRWLLKSPQHLGMLPALDDEFPDATVIFTHRDPASVFYSLFTMIGYLLRRTYSQVTVDQIMRITKTMQHGFLRGIVADAHRFEGRSEHVYFREFMQDYHATIEKVYAVSSMPYDAAAQERVAEQAEAYARGRFGARVVYDLEERFGFSREALRDEFSYYIDAFPVAIEETQQ